MSGFQRAPKSFLDVYNLEIAPKLREIDIFLKEKENPATIWQVSQLLDMPYLQVKEIIHNLGIKNLNHESIFRVIMAGTSRICGLIRRETERGFPVYYTPEDIAFIYEIDEGKIANIFETLGISRAKESCLPLIFDSLPPTDFNKQPYSK